MVDRWYYAHDEARLGPYSSEQLKELAAAGKILTTDTVWQEGVVKGALAAKVRYLFVEVASPPVTEGSEAASVVSVAAVLEAAQEFAGKPEPAKAPKEKKARPPSPVRRGMVVGGAGVIIVGQDGISFKYRKKCTTCGHEDSHWNTMKIMNGSTRVSFFCPKCRKNRPGEIRGSFS